MKLEELQDALRTTRVLRIASGHVRIAQGSLDNTFPPEALTPFHGEAGIEIAGAEHVEAGGGKFVVKGKTSFRVLNDPPDGLANPLLEDATEVLATFERLGNGALGVTLRYELPQKWRFSHSFPDLAPIFDDDSRQLSLDSLKLKSCYFYLTTHDHKLDDGSDVSLEKGLNFVGRWAPDGMLGLFERLYKAEGGADKLLHGPVILTSADPLWPLTDDQLPWDDRHRIPGIHLRADLGFGVSFPPDSERGMKLTKLRFCIYAPLSWLPLSDDASYTPTMTYVGDLVIPSIDDKPLAKMKAATRRKSGDELVIAGEFDRLTLKNLSAALKDVVGGDDSSKVLPKDAGHETAGLGLRSASIALLRSDNGYEVGSTQFTLGMGKGAAAWSLFGDLIKISFESLKIAVVRPFDSQQRAVYATIRGATEFLGVKLDVDVEYPGFRVSAEQQGITKVNLNYFKKQGMRLPGFLDVEFEIASIALVAEPGSHYAFSIDLAPGASWKIGGKYSLPNLRLAISCSTDKGKSATYLWQLEARTKEGEETVPVVELIKHLCSEVADFRPPAEQVPAMLNDFRIIALQVSFDTKSKDFAFTFDGELAIGGNPVNATVTLDLKHQADGAFATNFSGQIKVGEPGKEMQFALVFDKTDKSTRALAAYHDPYGEPQAVRDLVRPVSAALADKVPSSLAFAVHEALLGCSVESGANAKPKWLVGIDIEGGLDLSSVKLPDFPLLSRFAPRPDQTLKLAVQIVGTIQEFTVDEVRSLNALNAGGLRLPDKALNGLALAASLRLGQEVKQISLPIGLNDRSSAADTNSFVSSGESAVTASTPHSSAHAAGDDGMQWMMIQKSFGPVKLERVGIAYSGGKISGLLDAQLAAGGLTIALDGLSVTSPLTKFEPVFGLRGLGIDYRNGPLEIGGAFLKQTMQDERGTPYTAFGGLAVLRTQQLSLSAIGSYALKDGHPSLFIYALLDYPLGGPSFFFVTGLAAGFGYNRALTIPAIDQVEAFPLVQQASAKNEASEQQPLSARLAALEGHIPAAVGEHFLAIGLRFTSFKTINSFALLTVKFGKELEFDLLGLSTLEVPDVASAQLALKATFNPQAGFLGVRAQLTPNSYVLSRKCHLTGGFAFYSWFKDVDAGKESRIGAGDFVLTLGGYHPDYVPPAHYPRVPRLGFNWQVDDYLQLKGDAYYAMCPQAVMAGGHLEATWHKDRLKAWFTAGADFVMHWQPYHYDARAYVDLGASYTFDLFGSQTITVDMGADLHLWGPQMSGVAHVHWWIISFTVGFGDQEKPQGIAPISWETFKSAFLPEKNQICGIAVQQGLIRQIAEAGKDKTGKDCWIVNAKELVLVTNAVIPSTACTRIPRHGGAVAENPGTVAVRPVGEKSIRSTHQITITKIGEQEPVSDNFEYQPVYKAVPAALWGEPEFTDATKGLPAGQRRLKPPDVGNKKALIERTLAGFEIRPRRLDGEKGVPHRGRDECELIPDMFEWGHWALDEANVQGESAPASIDRKVLGNRHGILDALTRNKILGTFELAKAGLVAGR